MVKRPALTEDTFLSFVFHPSKNAQPKGLRKSVLKGTQGGRSKARLTAFNGMTAVNQAILNRTGTRDAYLRGEVTLREAKRQLRQRAVASGIVKPLRTRTVGGHALTALDRQIQMHFRQVVRAEGKPFNVATSNRQLAFLDADSDMLNWSYGEFRQAGSPSSQYTVMVGSEQHNPFWYH